ncbi:hypothetical protein L6452_21418 [Arctium lappa]|uniref:Uncharacterized protein n=1 Tax=Arctium lappa TaxID=4217 RepID=A0ACB9AW23_ARCLA|nr:hypothetical protein L6452_21418 [Arctium lappa]
MCSFLFHCHSICVIWTSALHSPQIGICNQRLLVISFFFLLPYLSLSLYIYIYIYIYILYTRYGGNY